MRPRDGSVSFIGSFPALLTKTVIVLIEHRAPPGCRQHDTGDACLVALESCSLFIASAGQRAAYAQLREAFGPYFVIGVGKRVRQQLPGSRTYACCFRVLQVRYRPRQFKRNRSTSSVGNGRTDVRNPQPLAGTVIELCAIIGASRRLATS